MPTEMAGPPDDALLSRYLLDDCSEEEKASVEAQFFASDETFERLCQLEEDMIARHARQELTGVQAAQFERAYGKPPRRDRVLLNVALGRLAAEPGALPAADTMVERARPRVDRLSERSGRARFADLPAGVRFGLVAAGIVLAAALGFQMQRMTQMRATLESERRQTESLRQQIAAAEQRASESERQAAALGDEVNRARGASAGSAEARPLVAAFLLSPGLTRGVRQPARVRVPETVDTVRLQLDLEDLSYRTFRAELRTAAGDIAWGQDALQPRATPSGRAVSVDVPAALVAAGEYELILHGFVEGGAFEDAGHYYFEVMRP